MQKSKEIITESKKLPATRSKQLKRKQIVDNEEDACCAVTEIARTRRERIAEEDVGSSCSSGRERLKKHWVEVAGRVRIPDTWGQEGFLKDWIDCAAFDASLVSSRIMSARASLAAEGRRSAMADNSTRLMRIANGC